MKKHKTPMPVLATMCATCPFRDGANPEHAQLAGVLTERVLSTASHVCHSTGARNAFHYRTGRQPALCRGARDIQLKAFAAMKFIEAPTDEAWNKQCASMGLPQIETIKKPIPTTRRKEHTK